MPTISVFKKFLWDALEKDAKYSIEDFEALGEHHPKLSNMIIANLHVQYEFIYFVFSYEPCRKTFL